MRNILIFIISVIYMVAGIILGNLELAFLVVISTGILALISLYAIIRDKRRVKSKLKPNKIWFKNCSCNK